jgi:fructose-1,6-bisphosphatase/inositol monophosphatase family enzyme
VSPIFSEQVAMLMRQVARDVVLPRYRKLADGDISEKAPGDLVTIVDHESEQRLAEGLLKKPRPTTRRCSTRSAKAPSG